MRRTRSRYADILEEDVHDDIFGRQLAFIINSQVSKEAVSRQHVVVFRHPPLWARKSVLVGSFVFPVSQKMVVPQYSLAHFVQFCVLWRMRRFCVVTFRTRL